MMFKRITGYFKGVSPDCLVTCIYFLCVPFTVVTTPFGSLLKLITIPVVGVLGYKTFFGVRKPVRLNVIHFIYTLYLADIFLGLFIYRDPETTLVQTKDMFLIFGIIMLISMRVYSQKEKKVIDDSWIVVGIVCTILCLTSTKQLNESESRTVVYVLGYAEDSNQICAYFIMPVMISLQRIIQKSKLMPVYLTFIVLMLYSVLKTGSRGGLIGIVIGIGFVVMLGVRSVKAKIGFVVGGILFAVFMVAVIFPMLPKDVQERYSIERVAEDKGAGRFEIWMYLLEYTGENPTRLLFGSGMLSTYEILGKAQVVEHAGVAHNQFVQAVADEGLIGLIAFLALIFGCFFRNWKKQPYYASAFMSVIAFSVSLTFYVFKPYINIIIMCAMNFEEESPIKDKNKTPLLTENRGMMNETD